MADLMFLHPRDLVTIYDQVCEIPDQQRSHVVGCGEANGIAVMSNFHAFLAKRRLAVEALRTVAPIEASFRPEVLLEHSQDKEFYVTCSVGEIHRSKIEWSVQWRAENSYSELPFEARLV